MVVTLDDVPQPLEEPFHVGDARDVEVGDGAVLPFGLRNMLGTCWEHADLEAKVNSPLRASKVNSPPDKGSWRRSGAAPATTKAPYKHPRAAKHEAAGAEPALPSASPHSPDCLSKEQHQPRAADSTGNSRQRRHEWRAANSAAAAPAASQPPLSPSKPCAEAADPPAAGLREAVALPPAWSRRVLHEAEGGLIRGGCPELEARGGRPVPFL
eukprot:scaffold88026_cov65-Phaeocystis_antarctica.AAC.2